MTPTERVEKESYEADFTKESVVDKELAYVLAVELEKTRAALLKIAHYDEESIWQDDRDDAAYEMLKIAREALGEES